MNLCACGCGTLVNKTWKHGHNPKLLGKHHSAETRRKISESNRGKQAGERHPFYGKKRPPATLQKMSEAATGRTHSLETRLKISASKLAEGASIKPAAVHRWLLRWYPKTGICDHCGKSGKTDYASLTGHNYTRARADYAELCPGCHLKFDYDNGQRESQAGVPKPRNR